MALWTRLCLPCRATAAWQRDVEALGEVSTASNDLTPFIEWYVILERVLVVLLTELSDAPIPPHHVHMMRLYATFRADGATAIDWVRRSLYFDMRHSSRCSAACDNKDARTYAERDHVHRSVKSYT
jgi:hypothetical protein